MRGDDAAHGHLSGFRVDLDLRHLGGELRRGGVRDEGRLAVDVDGDVAAFRSHERSGGLVEGSVARGLLQPRHQRLRGLGDRHANGEGRAASADAHVEGELVGRRQPHGDAAGLDAEVLGGDLLHHRGAALSRVGYRQDQGQRTVRVQHQLAAGVAPDGAALVHRDAASHECRFGVLPADGVQRGLQCLGRLDVDPLLPVRSGVAGLHEVLHAQFRRVDAEFGGDDVQLRLDREGDLGPAGRAHVAGGDDVGVRHVAFHVEGRHPVAARGLLHGVEVDVRHRLERAVRAAVEAGADLQRGQHAVVGDTRADRDLARVPGVRGEELLVVAHDDLDRPPGGLREQVGDRRVHGRALAAEVAAHCHRVDADGGRLDAERHGKLAPERIRALVGRPHFGGAVLRHRDHAGVRLHVDVVLLLRAEGVLGDALRRREARREVAARPAVEGAEVGQIGPFRVDERAGVGRRIVVDDGRAGSDRLLHVEDGGEFLVFDLDEVERLLRRSRGVGGHGCDPLADEPHLLIGQHREVFQRPADQAGVVAPGDDRMHAGHRPRPGRVDAHDPRVRIRAAQYLAPEQPFHLHVG